MCWKKDFGVGFGENNSGNSACYSGDSSHYSGDFARTGFNIMFHKWVKTAEINSGYDFRQLFLDQTEFQPEQLRAEKNVGYEDLGMNQV